MQIQPKARKPRPETRRLILDAAEVLFAERGFDGVGVREIMDRAGVNLGLATYHFRTKESLLESVIARRAEELGELRLAALARLRKEGNFKIEGILSAFIDPFRDFCQSNEPSWRSYAVLIAQLAQSQRWTDLVSRHFDPVLTVFIDTVMAEVPGLPRQACVDAFVFSIAVMVNVFASSQRSQHLMVGNTSRPDGSTESYDAMMTYVAAGFRATLRRASGDMDSRL